MDSLSQLLRINPLMSCCKITQNAYNNIYGNVSEVISTIESHSR